MEAILISGNGSQVGHIKQVLKDQSVQDYKSTYHDIRDWVSKERENAAQEKQLIDWEIEPKNKVSFAKQLLLQRNTKAQKKNCKQRAEVSEQ